MGMRITDSGDYHTFVDTGAGNSSLFLMMMQLRCIISLSSSDVATSLQELEKKGVKVRRGELRQYKGPSRHSSVSVSKKISIAFIIWPHGR